MLQRYGEGTREGRGSLNGGESSLSDVVFRAETKYGFTLSKDGEKLNGFQSRTTPEPQ